MTVKQPLKILSWLAVLFWMLVIFHFSAQPAAISNAGSKGIITRVIETTIKLTKTDIPESEKNRLIERVNNVAREYMHGVVFLVLGFLTQNAITRRSAKTGSSRIKAAAIALAVCIAYSLSDEVHQLFVPGRAFEISDLFMDATGSIIGISFAYFLSPVDKN